MIAAAPDETTKLLLTVLWNTGGRITEVLELKPNDLLPPDCIKMLNEKQVKVPKGAFRRKEYKFVYVPESVILDIESYAAARGMAQNAYVFQGRQPGKPMNRATAYRRLIRLSKDRNLTRERETEQHPYYETGLYPHLWRHGYAVNLMDQGTGVGVIKDQLGHKSLATTTIYAKVSDGVRRAAVRNASF
jgi:integrase